MIRPVVRSVVRTVVRKVAGETQVQRYITEFLTSAQSFGEATSTIVINSGLDYRVEVEFSATGSNEYYLLDGDGSSGRFFVIIDPTTGNISAFSGATVTVDGGPGNAQDFRDGVVHTAVISGTAASELRIGRIGSRFNGDFFLNGHPVALRVFKDSILTNDYPLDEEPTATEFVDRVGSNNITKQNIAGAQVDFYTLFTDVSPNEWRNADGSTVLPIAGT